MAKYEVLFACGHTATIQLFGKHTDRESYIAWCRGNRVCPACYECAKLEEKKKKLTEYKVESEKAKGEADAMGLPLLKGSEKQVSWAMNIRKKLLPVADNAYLYLEAHFDRDKYDKEEVLRLANEWLLRYKSQNKATFWIEHRDVDARELALACAKYVVNLINENNK